jgi:hypothetical protein
MRGIRLVVGAAAAAALMVGALVAPTYGAEKQRFTWSKKSVRTVSQTTIHPDDVAGHEMSQSVRVDAFTQSSGPAFVEAWSYVWNDTAGGVGSHRGHFVWVDRDGDKAAARFEGSHKVVAKGGGAWEVPYSGKFEFTVGTGKFQSIRGGGTYRGKATPEGLADEGDAEYSVDRGAVAGAGATSGAEPSGSPK